jgi:hypothetical protein
MGRLQVGSDGLAPYVGAMEASLGADVRSAQLTRTHGKPENAGPDWYGPPKVAGTVRTPVGGSRDLAHICTSHVERSHLSFRMQPRRFRPLVKALSKKPSNPKAAIASFARWYNACCIHQILDVIAAMEFGITGRVWPVAGLVGFSTEMER